jgi:hypothetical protein
VSAEVWLRTDELKEFIGALEFAAELLPSTTRDISRWKWEIVALHNALQGSFVCALSGADTAGISFLNDRSGDKMWRWLDATSRSQPEISPPNERLAEILILFERVKNSAYLHAPLRSNDQIDHDVRRLNDLRNDFIHFVPKALSIELSGMPSIVASVCCCIEHLAVVSPTFDHHFREGHRERISSALAVLKAFAEKG